MHMSIFMQFKSLISGVIFAHQKGSRPFSSRRIPYLKFAELVSNKKFRTFNYLIFVTMSGAFSTAIHLFSCFTFITYYQLPHHEQ